MQSRVNKIHPRNNFVSPVPSLLNVKTVKGVKIYGSWILQIIITVQELARVGEYDNVK